LDHQCTTTAAMGCEESKPDQTQEWTEAQPAEGGRRIEVLIPDGAVEGAQLDFKSPDGVWMKATVPEGYNPGDKISVLVPEEAPKKEKKFKSLHQAFQYMDKKFTGYITDHSLFAEVAKDLLGLEGTTEEIWSTLDQDGNGQVNWPEFVEWAEANHVELELGAPGLGADGAVAFPPLWQGPKDDPSFVGQYDVEDDDHFKELIELVRKTYKKVWTRDRKKTGSDKVPSSFELVKAKRCENLKDWKRYYFRRHQIAHACSHKTGFMKRPVLTSEAKKLSKRQGLRGHCNEQWSQLSPVSWQGFSASIHQGGSFSTEPVLKLQSPSSPDLAISPSAWPGRQLARSMAEAPTLQSPSRRRMNMRKKMMTAFAACWCAEWLQGMSFTTMRSPQMLTSCSRAASLEKPIAFLATARSAEAPSRSSLFSMQIKSMSSTPCSTDGSTIEA